MKRVLRGAVLWGSAAVFAVYLLCAVCFGVWSLGTWVGLALSGAAAAGAACWPRWRSRWREGVKKRLLSVIFAIFILSAAYFAVLAGCMVSGALRAPPEEPAGTVVILGSKVNGTVPSADLQARIDCAAAYLLEHPELSAVASGGQGAGEAISEAQAIRDGLVAQGVEPSRIFLEDQSSDTEENIAFTLQVMEENGLSGPLLLVTDEYHEFRANELARRAGAESYAVSGATPLYLLPACAARELLALTKLFLFSWL